MEQFREAAAGEDTAIVASALGGMIVEIAFNAGGGRADFAEALISDISGGAMKAIRDNEQQVALVRQGGAN